MPVKISALPSLGTMTDAAIIPVVASSTTSQISGANLKTYFSSVTGNITGGNINTGGVVSATGSVTGSQFNGSGAGLSSIPGANVLGAVANATYATNSGTVTTAAQGNITSVGTLTSLGVTGNITGGNINVAGMSLSGNVVSAINTTANITTTANISGSYVLGNGSQLTGMMGPIFMAYNSANQNLTTGAVVLIFGTTTVNTNSYYNTSTGVFTPLVPGYYQVNVSVFPELVSGTANASMFTGLYKNGSLVAAGGTTAVTPTWGTISPSAISTLVYLNGTTDYLGIASLNTINSGTWRSGISVANFFQATWVHA